MNLPGRLENKVSIITGSSRGIGKAIAIEFGRQGSNVFVTYHKEATMAEAVVKEITSSGGNALAYQIDICSRSSIKNLFAAVCEKFGRIDVLVNNAGFLEQKPFLTITDDDWDYTISVNLKSVFVCSQEIMPFFEKNNSGSIINITSVGGQTGGQNAVHYAAAKAGVISLTKSAARLFAKSGVRVNAIAPGFIRTDMYYDIISRTSEKEIFDSILLKRAGEPEEVALSAVFLASEEASYITGHILNINGGSYLAGGC